MVSKLVLAHGKDWLLPGDTSDLQLLHSDCSDQLLVCPPHLGRGYFQEILLKDDLALVILDYTLNQDVWVDLLNESSFLEFEFQLVGPGAGYSFFIPHFGLKEFGVKRLQRRLFKIEVVFKQPLLVTYFQAFMERLSPQTRYIAERVIQTIYLHLHQRERLILTTSEMLNRIVQSKDAVDSHLTLERILPESLYSETIAFKYVNRNPITSVMQQVIGQILSCPYQGEIRRAYLERKALKLVSLQLEMLIQRRLNESKLNYICQAASILRNQITHPPAVEALAKQVGTNRLKLNQGFHKLYGTTPFGYLQDCRLWQARRLLMTSNLSIGEVSGAVGYTSCSRFATAFRKKMGINPKSFQIQTY
ncbi:MAG: helix-turn-helix transcriptional regulator [Leptolyngbya sp. SIO1D8]|nr:helix-turn-helix transcriptional regulator [Leptolyngbya sp. SIO1D8]